MPDLHPIKLLLGIKDENIQITHVEKKKIHSINSIVVSARLIKTIHRCPQCKQVNQRGLIVKNGKKKSLVLLNKCANQLTYLALAKQRCHCCGYHTYFTANTYIVEKNCFIAKQVRYKMLEELTEKQVVPYSFSCMDGDTGKLLDILPSRKKKDLVSYFMLFERRTRLNVKYS